MSNYSEIPNNLTDCISRQAVIDSLYDWSNHSMTDAETWHLRQVIGDIKSMPSVTPQLSSELEKNSKKLEKDFGELDCISRAEAIKCLECDFDITGKENMKTVVNYINSAHDKIVNLPRVKQEPKTGHWIPSHIPESILDECSECGFSCGAFTFNYCPNCGAKMESEDKE